MKSGYSTPSINITNKITDKDNSKESEGGEKEEEKGVGIGVNTIYRTHPAFHHQRTNTGDPTIDNAIASIASAAKQLDINNNNNNNNITPRRRVIDIDDTFPTREESMNSNNNANNNNTNHDVDNTIYHSNNNNNTFTIPAKYNEDDEDKEVVHKYGYYGKAYGGPAASMLFILNSKIFFSIYYSFFFLKVNDCVKFHTFNKQDIYFNYNLITN